MTTDPANDPIDEALRQPPIRLWRRLVRITNATIKQVEEALSPLNLSMTEFDLLAVVRAHEGSTQQELAQRLLFSAPNVTYHAQRLVNRGLLQRETTGKYKRLYLTPAGSTLIDRALPLVVQLHERQFEQLDPLEQQQLEHLLKLLR